MKETELQNGLKIFYEPMPNTHSVTVGLYILAGTRFENKCNTGISHLLEHLHFRQLCGMSQEELYYEMECIGSTLRAATYYDFIKFSMKFRPRHFSRAIGIFKNILSAYDWEKSNFEQEKAVVKKQINENDASYSEERYIRESLFEGDSLAYGIMGTEETVSGITAADIIKFKKQIFNRNNMVLCITGCADNKNLFEASEILKSVEIPIGDRLKPKLGVKRLYKRKPDVVFYKDEWDFIDAEIAFDIDYRSVSIPDLKILNCILGEGVGSRLQKTVREKLAFTTDIRSEPEFYSDFAVLHIKFSVSKDRLTECLSYVLNIISDLKYDINSRDLDVTLPFYTDNCAFLNDDTENMNFELAYNRFVLEQKEIGFAGDNSSEYREKLMNIARTVFIPENTSVILFGDCRGITKKSVKDIVFKFELSATGSIAP